MNLLNETVAVLALYDKSPEDVSWVGGDEWWFTWEEFAVVADRGYDHGFGAQKVASDLVVVGNGWWMVRDEYDGSEGWEFVEPISKPPAHRKPKNLFARIGWERLTETDSHD